MRLPALCLLLLSLFVLVQCQENVILQDNDPEIDVDAELAKYFVMFETEGISRGLDIDLEAAGITGNIIDIPNNNVAGQCQYGSHLDPLVLVDADFWENSSELGKELIVFHELGHCFLKRDHNEEKMEDDICASMMRSGNGSCYDNYNSSTRSYYLDELFLEN